MLVLGKNVVSDKVNGYAIDGGKNAPVLGEIRVKKIDNVSNFGRRRGGVVNRGGVGEASGCKDVNVICAMIVDVRHRALEPAVEVIRSQDHEYDPTIPAGEAKADLRRG